MFCGEMRSSTEIARRSLLTMLSARLPRLIIGSDERLRASKHSRPPTDRAAIALANGIGERRGIELWCAPLHNEDQAQAGVRPPWLTGI